MGSWWSIWLLMLVWKDRVLNNHSLHRGREDSSYLLAPQAVPQYSCSFVSVLCSQVRPCPTRADESVVDCQLFILRSCHLGRYLCHKSHHSYGQQKGFMPFSPWWQAGWHTCVVNHLHVFTHVLRQEHFCVTRKDLWAERFSFSLGFAFLLIIYLFKPGYIRTMRGYVKMCLSVDLRWVTEVLEFAILTPWLYNKAEVSPILALSALRKSGF